MLLLQPFEKFIWPERALLTCDGWGGLALGPPLFQAGYAVSPPGRGNSRGARTAAS